MPSSNVTVLLCPYTSLEKSDLPNFAKLSQIYFFCKYFRLCGPFGFCCNYWTLPIAVQSSRGRDVNERVWLSSLKTSLQKQCARLGTLVCQPDTEALDLKRCLEIEENPTEPII